MSGVDPRRLRKTEIGPAHDGRHGASTPEFPSDKSLQRGRNKADTESRPSFEQATPIPGQRISSEFSTKQLLKASRRRLPAPDRWSKPKILPRAVGGVLFALPIIAVVVGFSIALGCSRCYSNESGSQVEVPERFSISDTLRQSPTRWTGLALFALTSICGAIMGGFRHVQIRDICMDPFPKLLALNTVSAYFGVSFCILLAASSAVPPADPGSAIVPVRLAITVCLVASIVMYLVIQHGWIERVLVKEKVIRAVSHNLRFLLLLVAGIAEIALIPVTAVKIYMFDSEGSSGAAIIGTLHLVLEFSAILHLTAAVGLTDFGSVSVNLTKLEKLQSITYNGSVGVISQKNLA
ncbi:hypothetical protein BSKO_12070 [Bryopsis sp. KO-2023]|nr:hypothetical protein BSKO_12070 [Bryopsis sp. KO-2023]